MTELRGFAITMASAIVGAVLGAGIGWMVASWTPTYYRTVFGLPDATLEELRELGTGVGMLQGLGTGIAVGLIVVLIVAWYEVRRLASQPTPDESS
ncbi:hypothetical protein KOR42_01980 [Thalassoglobus neptunius]|uniref:Uncharacterized protein n=1 Tax=Thalassoglobus neptunius TaxID=1938619 RepID=A0A5C5X3P8_9PLAN|nr:hypothetical protein [Thalassoglobus neptunius]TWT56843.1 hypothetical protein KOR42_01980 [Thalassoglobus neptunius]